MNPQKSWPNYGKLMFLLRDSRKSDVKKQLGGSLLKNIITVGSFLESKAGFDLLGSEEFETATQDLSGLNTNKLSRAEIEDLQVTS